MTWTSDQVTWHIVCGAQRPLTKYQISFELNNPQKLFVGGWMNVCTDVGTDDRLALLGHIRSTQLEST